MSPDTVVALYRQQVYNWKANDEPRSEVKLNNVLATDYKVFYVMYIRARKGEGYSQKDVEEWFDARTLILEAVRRKEAFPFEPTRFDDVVQFGAFLQEATRKDFRQRLELYEI